MTTGPDELRAKMAQIAGRYLERVTKEIVQLRTLIDNAASGGLEGVREIEALTHRMHGSGAVLQFEEISGHAGELERMAAGLVARGQGEQPRMVETLGKLQVALDQAVAERAAQNR